MCPIAASQCDGDVISVCICVCIFFIYINICFYLLKIISVSVSMHYNWWWNMFFTIWINCNWWYTISLSSHVLPSSDSCIGYWVYLAIHALMCRICCKNTCTNTNTCTWWCNMCVCIFVIYINICFYLSLFLYQCIVIGDTISFSQYG